MAHQDMGALRWSVTEPSGAAISGASLTITEETTGVTDVVESDVAGNCFRPLIKPGTYTIACESPGFKRSVQVGVVLQSAGGVQLILAGSPSPQGPPPTELPDPWRPDCIDPRMSGRCPVPEDIG